MIKKFKQFNEQLLLESNVEMELVEYLDDNYIEEYYQEKYDISAEEVIDLYPSIIFDHIDDDRFVEDWKEDEKANRDIDEYDEYEFKPYIEKHLDDEKSKKIKEYYRNKEGIDDDIIADEDGVILINDDKDEAILKNSKGFEEEIDLPEEHRFVVKNGDKVSKGDKITKLYYDDDMLDKLDSDQMKSIIEEVNEEEEFIDELVESWYDYNTSARDIVENVYGNPDNMSGDELYKWFYNYIDDDALVDSYKSNEDFEYMKEYVADQIDKDLTLQETILEANKKSALELAELFNGNVNYTNISDTYDFQKAFIESYVEEYADPDDKDSVNQEIADALIKLAVEYKFDLDSDIKDEYDDYMYGVDANKFNV